MSDRSCLGPVLRLSAAGALLGWLLAAAAMRPARAQTARPRSLLLPPDSLLSVEVADAGRALRAFVGVRRLFPLRPGRQGLEPVLLGDKVAWLPSVPAAEALIYTLELPYRNGLGGELARLIERAEGPVAAAVLPNDRGGTDAVLLLAFADGGFPERPPEGFHAAVVGPWWILSTSRAAVDRVRAWQTARPARPRSLAAGAGYRIRCKLRRLWIHQAWAVHSTLGALRHFVPDLPEVVEIAWRRGEETIRIRAGGLAAWLAPGAAPLTPRYLYGSCRFSAKLVVPAGLEGVRGLLVRDPLGVYTALARAWPGRAPDLAALARHLTGRFQVHVLQNSSNLVPVVGLELRDPGRGRAWLERRLVATGLCEQHPFDRVGCAYPRRLPRWLRDNGMLRMFFRRMANPPREYLVAIARGWVWLGPRKQTDMILRALQDEAARAARREGREPGRGPAAPAGSGGGAVFGRFELNLSPLWNDLLYEQGRMTAGEAGEPVTTRKLRDARGELVRSLGLFAYTVDRDGADLVFQRRVSYARSLLPVLAARGYRSYRAIHVEEEGIRRAARRTLQQLHAAEIAYRKRKGRFAASLEELEAAGLWRRRWAPAEDGPEADREEPYAFGVVREPQANGPGVAVFALPRGRGPAGVRPAYLIGPDGQLFVGAVEPGGSVRLPEGALEAHGWRRTGVD